MNCKLCGDRGFIVESEHFIKGELAEKIRALLERPGIKIVEPGLELKPCPACRTTSIRALFWAASMVSTKSMDLESVENRAEALWERWMKHQEEGEEEGPSKYASPFPPSIDDGGFELI